MAASFSIHDRRTFFFLHSLENEMKKKSREKQEMFEHIKS